MAINSCVLLISNVTHRSPLFRESGIDRNYFMILQQFQRPFQLKGGSGSYILGVKALLGACYVIQDGGQYFTKN